MIAFVSRLVVIVGLGVSLTGCLQSTSLVRLKPDGSGTIEQTMLVNLQAVKGMLGGLGAAAQGKETGGVLNEADFKRSAERMGVRPVSLTPMKEGGFEGAKALYAFDDISKVRLDQDPQLSGSTSGSFSSAPTSRNPIRFALARQGATSTLSITVDEKATADATAKAGAAAGGATPELDPAMMQMIKTVFNGFKVLIDLEVDGTIVKTNADYVSGSRITLLELDMAGLFADEAKLKALQSQVRPGMSLSEVRPLLKDIKGVKVNNPSLTVEFR